MIDTARQVNERQLYLALAAREACHLQHNSKLECVGCDLWQTSDLSYLHLLEVECGSDYWRYEGDHAHFASGQKFMH